jgi:hypothetical protein
MTKENDKNDMNKIRYEGGPGIDPHNVYASPHLTVPSRCLIDLDSLASSRGHAIGRLDWRDRRPTYASVRLGELCDRRRLLGSVGTVTVVWHQVRKPATVSASAVGWEDLSGELGRPIPTAPDNPSAYTTAPE